MHRDLKLENILLDKQENVKLVDFGFTREYEGKSNYLQTWCGTVCYSAPEMLKGEKYAGEKVDVWSLGIILFALLSGELPFDEDDETATKAKILKEEPVYPEHIPQGAKGLIVSLLSKRSLLRPSLADILTNPWLAEHAPQQQAILKLQQSAPFTTDLEKETLQRMRSAGVDIDLVIENVLAQRCDPLAGWWALLLEKEERKENRRQRKRKEREAEVKSIRRLSAASGRLERLAPTIREMDEENHRSPIVGDPPPSKSRGRNMRRQSSSSQTRSRSRNLRESSLDLQTRDPPGLPRVQEPKTPESATPPPPLDKDSVRSVSSSRHRPGLPPKEANRSKSSMLQVVTTNPDLLHPNGYVPKKRRKYQQPFMEQLATLKHWFKESAKRARSPHPRRRVAKSSAGTQGEKEAGQDKSLAGSSPGSGRRSSKGAVDGQGFQAHQVRPRLSTTPSAGSNKRLSLSPSPLTPRSSYRRSSAGLRGRKSTSSSVSSIRSMHHHTHSKTSSTSSASASVVSPSASNRNSMTRSPHTSVKVLPATPTTSSFPSNIRVVRAGSIGEARGALGGLGPPSPGLVFAKRRRSAFKGPLLSISTAGPAGGTAGTGLSPGRGAQRGEAGGSRSDSLQGRRSGEIIEEEDEDEFEEVDAFSPIVAPGEEVVLEEEGDGIGLDERGVVREVGKKS